MNNIQHIHVVVFLYTHRSLVKGLAQVLLNEHEILTLGREYGERSWPPLLSLMRIVQDDLKKYGYSKFKYLHK